MCFSLNVGPVTTITKNDSKYRLVQLECSRIHVHNFTYINRAGDAPIIRPKDPEDTSPKYRDSVEKPRPPAGLFPFSGQVHARNSTLDNWRSLAT